MSFRSISLSSLAVSACLAASAMAQDKSADTVVATVGGVDITIGHMALVRDSLPDQYRNLEAEVLYDGILQQLIQQTLLAQTIDELPERVELILENAKREAVASEALSRIMNSAVSDAQVRAAYEREIDGLEPESEFNASHILLDTIEDANNVLEAAQTGQDFAELAKEFSTGPSGPNGGQLGWFGAGQMVSEFEDAVFSMSVGEVVGPVQTQFGFHIIRLNDSRQKAVPSFEERSAALMEGLQRVAMEDTLAALEEAGDIERTEGIDPNVIMDLSVFDTEE